MNVNSFYENKLTFLDQKGIWIELERIWSEIRRLRRIPRSVKHRLSLTLEYWVCKY